MATTKSLRLPTRVQNKLLKRKRASLLNKSFLKPSEQADESFEEPDSGADDSGLAWRPVPRSNIPGGFDDAAVLAFEELEDVDVQYEDAPGGGRVVKLVKQTTEEKAKARPNKKRRLENPVQPSFNPLLDDFDGSETLPEWEHIALSSALKRSIYNSSFTSPTDIQSRALPLALEGKDIVGVAETGSGKTLAYGLPIIDWCIKNRPVTTTESRQLKALVLAPTRELALQVSEHLNAIIPRPQESDEKAAPGTRPPPAVSVAALVGGMSAHKQKRVLERGVDILIATPGRLWDTIQEDDSLALQIRSLRFLVLDEADRMIEAGHFEELDNIIKLTLRPGAKSEEAVADIIVDPEFAALEAQAGLLTATLPPNASLQTFVYSATLSKDLQKNLSRRKTHNSFKKHKKTATTLDDLVMRLDFRDAEPSVIDISPEGGAVSTLQESKIECLTNDKDLYLYYFLLRYPGRTIVFVSSIDGIRRIMPLLEILQINAHPLHSQLQQKQRLKNLDRFKSTPNAVLISTDVAARGLDVSGVDHVVHYQIPRSADVYVHRNGRTARAKREGFSLSLCGPDERKTAKALLSSLGRDEDLPELSVDHDMLTKLKERVTLARQIDNAQHNVKKENHEQKWLRETAEAMELELDPELLGDAMDDDELSSKSKKAGKSQAKVATLKNQLRQMLAQPLVARGISAKYLTSGSRALVDELVNASNHQSMLGVRGYDAKKDVGKKRKHLTSKAP